MGSDDGEPEEAPSRDVTLSAFFIDETEATVESYRACVAAGDCAEPDVSSTYFMADSDRFAVDFIDWFDARDYCVFAGKRLPTEAEWEKAARGTEGGIYPWGNEMPTCDLAVMADIAAGYGCGLGTPGPVGSKPEGASPYGALDMAGNAREWVADWYAFDYYSEGLDVDPTGPDSGMRRVMRGGDYAREAADLRSARRFDNLPDIRIRGFGTRCASDAQ